MPWQKDALLNPSNIQPLSIYFSQKESSSQTTSSSSSFGSKISQGVLFFIVILAVIFFISGLLHLLVWFLMKHRPSLSFSQSSRNQEIPNSGAVQIQLQQLFHLHDSGLDQAFIDALPVFSYKDIMGQKEPFDCAVCLCEFSDQDNLRLLPLCSHAFHIDCIDTWLLSNSTCPLCRGILFAPDFCVENPIFYFDDSRDEDGGGSGSLGITVSSGSKPAEDDAAVVSDKRVFSVRLGKFWSTNNNVVEVEEKEIGETSNSNLDARRCYSMGSFQYVVGDSELQVALCPNGGGGGNRGGGAQLKVGRGRGGGGQNGNFPNDDGKRINMRSKGESFSVSKIWLWSKKDKFPSSANTSINNTSLPWTDRVLAA